MIQRLAIDSKYERSTEKYEKQKKEYETCLAILIGYIITIPLAPFCMLSKPSEEEGLGRKIASYKGELEAIDSQIKQCKSEKSKIEINNNINIENRNDQ